MTFDFFGKFAFVGKGLTPWPDDIGLSIGQLLNRLKDKYYLDTEELACFYEDHKDSEEPCQIVVNGKKWVDLSYIPKKGDKIKISNIIKGSGGRFTQIIIGIALIALAFWNPFAWSAALVTALYATGIAFTINGVFGLIFGGPKPPTPDERQEERQSKFFNGPTITTGEGSMGPWGYGEALVGGHLASAKIRNVDDAGNQNGGGSTNISVHGLLVLSNMTKPTLQGG